VSDHPYPATTEADPTLIDSAGMPDPSDPTVVYIRMAVYDTGTIITEMLKILKSTQFIYQSLPL